MLIVLMAIVIGAIMARSPITGGLARAVAELSRPEHR